MIKKRDLTIESPAYGPLGLSRAYPVWSALYARQNLYDGFLCWTVVFGQPNGPPITEATAFAMARDLLAKDPELALLRMVSPGTPWAGVNKRQREMWDLHQQRQRGSGFTLIELLIVIAIMSILGAMLTHTIRRAQERAKARTAQQATNSVPEDPPNHLIYKTNFLIISGLEEDPKTELPPGYALLSNEWGGFCFRDGDAMIHPFWADGAWQTEEGAIRAAWLSHTRRQKEQHGLLKPPNYTIVRTNQTQ